MIVYRVGKKQYSRELLGEGARLFGGRWNSVGTPCLYTSESRALAVLEFSVNLQASSILDTLSITVIEIPDADILTISLKQMPQDWNIYPTTSVTQLFGTNLLQNNAVIQIPSSVIFRENNFLLNPRHENSSSFKILDVEHFRLDDRIKV